METPLEELFESSLSLDLTDDTLRQIPAGRGVLLFADSSRRPIQMLLSANLRRTALAKLSESRQETDRKADLRPIARFLYYTPAPCDLHSTWLYNRLVHILFSDKSNDLICLPTPHCVRIDPDEDWTSFTPSNRLYPKGSAVYWGPLPTRKAAELFAQALNEAFELCRNPRFIRQGHICTYFQMGICAAPCMQTGEENRYRQAVRQAIEAADGPIEHILESLSNQMKIQAGKMQFEKAQTIKNRIDQMGRLKVRSYRWTQRMDKLKILHISQSSSKVSFENLRQKNTVFSGYLISFDRIEKVANFTLSSIPTFLDRTYKLQNSHRMACENLSEHLGLVSLFLYKSRPPGLWLDLSQKSLIDELMIKEAIVGCFGAKTVSEN